MTRAVHRVTRKQQGPAVLTRGEAGERWRDDLDPSAHQPQVGGYIRTHRTERVCERRHVEARVDLARNGGAADCLASFEHDWPISSPRQVERRNQAVVAGADDYDAAHAAGSRLRAPGSGADPASELPGPNGRKSSVCIVHRALCICVSCPPYRCASLMTAHAAFRPGAAMMPPPGCAPEPHRYRPRTGVRYLAHPGAGRRKNSCSSDSSPWKMFPSVSPNSRSRSRGVSTCRCRMMSRMFGANSAIVSITASPKASRSASQVVPRR